MRVQAARCVAPKLRYGRKRLVALDGSGIVPSSKPQPDGALVT